MADSDTFGTILPAGTVITANGNTGPMALASNVDSDNITIAINISAATGTTPGVVFTAQIDSDASFPPGSYATGTATASITAAGRTVLTLPAPVNAATGTVERYYKLSWVVSGTTPSFTVGIYGE